MLGTVLRSLWCLTFNSWLLTIRSLHREKILPDSGVNQKKVFSVVYRNGSNPIQTEAYLQHDQVTIVPSPL